MISKKNFIVLFNNIVLNDILKFSFSSENEEGIFEFQVYDKNDILFYTYDNRIYINCNFDIDSNLIGRFDSIDGETNELLLVYDNKEDFTRDLTNLLTTYDSYR